MLNLERAIEFTRQCERTVNVLSFLVFALFAILMLTLCYLHSIYKDRAAYWTKIQQFEIENARLRVESETRLETIKEMTNDFKKGVIRDVGI